MTDNRAQPFWVRQAGVYTQQDVIEPPLNQNPNNAAHAVWHLGEAMQAEYYPSRGDWRTGDNTLEDGRYDRGDATLVSVYAVTYPHTMGSDNTLSPAEGERSEGKRVFIVDSNQLENAASAQNHPTLFANGHLFVAGSDSDGEESLNNHATIFLYGGNRWEVESIKLWNEARNELTSAHGGVYECVARLYRHRAHEKDAQRGLKHRSATPGINDDTYDEWKT